MTGICIILKQYIPGAGNLDFEVKLTKNLRFVSTNGLTYYNYDDFSYTDPAAFGGRAPDIKGTTSSSNAIRWTKYTNQMLKYDNEWEIIDSMRLSLMNTRIICIRVSMQAPKDYSGNGNFGRC